MNIKLTFSLIAFFLFHLVNTITSQSDSEIGILLTGGVKNWTYIANRNLEDNGLSLGAGIVTEHQILKERLSVQLGVLFRNRGDCEEFPHTDSNGDPLGTDRVNTTKGDLSFPVTVKYLINQYYLGVGVEAGINILNRTKGDKVGKTDNELRKGAVMAWHSKIGLRKKLSDELTLGLELEYVNNWKDSFTNLHIGIGINYNWSS